MIPYWLLLYKSYLSGYRYRFLYHHRIRYIIGNSSLHLSGRRESVKEQIHGTAFRVSKKPGAMTESGEQKLHTMVEL